MSGFWTAIAFAGPPCTEARPGIVINEFVANPPSTDTGLEWVEIHNGTGQTVDLSGWQIAAGTSDYGLSAPLPGGTSLAAGGYLVVGTTALPEVDVVADGFSLGNASSDADAVQLRDCVGGVADTIVYGGPNDDYWLDDLGVVAENLAPEPPDGGTLGRLPDGVDTDNSAVDVIELPYTTPGEANDAPPNTCGGPGSGLVINEILPDPDGSDAGLEWIELYHGGSEPIDLAGWAVQMGTSSLSTKFSWKEGRLEPGERLLLGGELVEDADILVESLSLGNASSNADAVAVVDCLGFASDTLVYGTPNEDEFTDDSGAIATSLAPAPGSAASLQRLTDGYDTDDCANDFAVTLDPTPGEPNEEVEPVVCVPSEGDITINEILPDPDGTDEDLEWIELYNSSDEDVSLAGWALSLGTQDFESRDIIFAGDVEIEAHGFLLVRGSDVEVEDVDDLEAVFSLGNGTETDGVRLFDCEGEAVDTVLYGDAPNLDGMMDDDEDVVDPYGDPGSAESLARVEDGADSDEAEDWKVTGIPTPGATNVRDLGDIDGEIDRPGCQCGGGSGAPDGKAGRGPSDPNGGCSQTGRMAPGLLWMLAAIVLRRRT
jgi:hypothetical protein